MLLSGEELGINQMIYSLDFWTELERSLVQSLFSIIYKFGFARTPEVFTNNLISFDS